MNQHRELLSASEAAERLGVKVDTLYAYVSRGLVRSVAHDGPGRRYARADIERLRARRDARRGGPMASTRLEREPVLDSRITWFGEDGPVYRGHPALELAAEDVAYERVVELLLTGELPGEALPAQPLGGLSGAAIRAVCPSASAPIARLQCALPWLAERDPTRYDTRPEVVLEKARGLIRTLPIVLAEARGQDALDGAHAAPTVAGALVHAVGARSGTRVRAALNRVLVLLADHELNASTFAARVAASTRADVYSCLCAALGALAGPRHGLAVESAADFVASIGRPERVEDALRDQQRRGEPIPGCGHAVYEGVDPRARLLFATAREVAPRSRVVRTVDALVEALERAQLPAPNVDCSLVSFAAATGIDCRDLPGVFAVARTAGWIAHVLEQYVEPRLLRPRARYPD